MDVSIGTLTANVRATGGAGSLSPETTQAIVALVLAALDDRNRRAMQAASDTQIGGGTKPCGGGSGQ